MKPTRWLRPTLDRMGKVRLPLSVIDVHVYGGILLLATGAGLVHIGLGLSVAGAALVYLGLRGR